MKSLACMFLLAFATVVQAGTIHLAGEPATVVNSNCYGSPLTAVNYVVVTGWSADGTRLYATQTSVAGCREIVHSGRGGGFANIISSMSLTYDLSGNLIDSAPIENWSNWFSCATIKSRTYRNPRNSEYIAGTNQGCPQHSWLTTP